MSSTNVEDEWQYYLDQQKPVIPIFYRPAKVHFQLSRIQYINFQKHEYDDALRQLHSELGRKGIALNPMTASGTSVPIPAQKPLPVIGERGRSGLLVGAVAIIAVLIVAVVLIAQGGGGAGVTDTLTPTLTITQPGVVEVGSPTPTLTPSLTPTRTRRPVLLPEQLTATEQRAQEEAETEVALTETSLAVPGFQHTSDALTVVAELFTNTPTPNRVATRFWMNRTATENARQTETGAPLVSSTPTGTPTQANLRPYPITCEDAPPTRLNVGMRARVTIAPEGGQSRNQNLRVGPGTDYDLAATIGPGREIVITGEPQCVDGIIWWQVETAGGFVRGWTAEGAITSVGALDYYIEPLH
jgi:hypothetical protein